MLAVMRWGLASWRRVEFVNSVLGTGLPRLALDFVPGVRCSAHFALIARTPLDAIDRQIAAGRAVQRFWLTAASLGLQMQPSYTPLVFARYAREGRAFSVVPDALTAAAAIGTRIVALLGHEAHEIAWFGRLGPARAVAGRSLRLPLSTLMVCEKDDQESSTGSF
jgi:hypothetical protein